jgi:hypothetical protein
MKQDRDNLEILIDTSWGVYMILKCEGVLENSLNCGNTYDGIDVKIEDEFIEFVLGSIYGGADEVLRVRQVSFKPIFERRIKIEDLKYEVSKSGLSLNIGNNWVDCSNNGILDFKQRKVLGYLQNDNVMQAFIVFNQEIAFKFCEYSNNKKRSAKLKSKVAEFQSRCQENGFCFDKYPLYDCDSEQFEFDWGELLYVHKYSESKRWLSTGKIILFTLLGSCAIWIPMDLFITQAPGHIFLIIGLGIWLYIALLMVYSTLLGRFLDNKRGNSAYLEIRENGLKYSCFNRGFNVDYENIVAVEYKKRIIIHAWIKYELEGFKNDIEAYELIKKQVEKSKNKA